MRHLFSNYSDWNREREREILEIEAAFKKKTWTRQGPLKLQTQVHRPTIELNQWTIHQEQIKRISKTVWNCTSFGDQSRWTGEEVLEGYLVCSVGRGLGGTRTAGRFAMADRRRRWSLAEWWQRWGDRDYIPRRSTWHRSTLKLSRYSVKYFFSQTQKSSKGSKLHVE